MAAQLRKTLDVRQDRNYAIQNGRYDGRAAFNQRSMKSRAIRKSVIERSVSLRKLICLSAKV
jgi:hypothetical protein